MVKNTKKKKKCIPSFIIYIVDAALAAAADWSHIYDRSLLGTVKQWRSLLQCSTATEEWNHFKSRHKSINS